MRGVRLKSVSRPERVSMKYAVIAFMVLSAGSAFAHHSATAAYFADKKPTVKGTVVQFLFRNPHSFLAD